jgi:capsular polysaccharide transport system permease protein
MLFGMQRYGAAFLSWQRAIWTAMGQLLDTYARGNWLFLVMEFAEPVVAIVMIYLLRSTFKVGFPHFGSSLFLFYASGFLPFYLFLRISSRARSSKLDPRWRPPGLTVLDMYITTTALNALIWIVVTVVLFFAMWLHGITEARPYSTVDCIVPLALFIAFGLGVGMINNVISRYFPLWNTIYAVLTRGLLFFSGVLYIVDLLPPWMRYWISWNPLLHGLEWFRVGIYGRYPDLLLDKAYFVEIVLITLFLGMVVDRASIRRLARA